MKYFIFLITLYFILIFPVFAQNVYTEQEREDLINNILSTQPKLSVTERESLKKELQTRLAISYEDIAAECNNLSHKDTCFSSPEDGFVMNNLFTKPEYTEMPIKNGKVKKYAWIEKGTNTYYAFRVLISGPYEFDESKWHYDKRLGNLKVAVIGSTKVTGGEILNFETANWKNIKPLIFFTVRVNMQGIDCLQMDYAFSHRNCYFQIGVRFPEYSLKEGINKFKWFTEQIDLF